MKWAWLLDVTANGKEESHSDKLRSEFIRYLRDTYTVMKCAKTSEKWIKLVISKNLECSY